MFRENPAVHLADIQDRHPAGEDIPHCLLDVLRDAGVLGEMVQQSERQHAQRPAGAHQPGGERVHRSVAAPGNDGIALLVHGLGRQREQLAAVVGPHDVRPRAVLAGDAGQMGLGRFTAPPPNRFQVPGSSPVVQDAGADGGGSLQRFR